MASSLKSPVVTSAWFSDLVDFVSRCTLILFFYGLIVVVSLCGNILVCKTALSKYTRNSTNYLIANLAFSDILMTIINIPITVIDIMWRDWVFGQYMCSLVPFLQAVCVYVSSFSMLTIAINRYYLVYHNQHKQPPLKAHRPRSSSPALEPVILSDLSPASRRASSTTPHLIVSKESSKSPVPSACLSRNLCLLLAFIWLVALLHSIPFAMHNQLVFLSTTSSRLVRRCRLSAREPFTELTLTLFAFLTQYLVPLVISALIYLRIGFTISRLGLQPKQPYSNTCSGPNKQTLLVPSRPLGRESVESLQISRREEVLLHKRRRILLLALIVSIFAFCWLPFHVYFLLKDFSLIESNGRIFLVCHWLAMSSVCYNPFVYFWLNEQFRTEARKLLMVLYECRLFKTKSNVTNGKMAKNEFADASEGKYADRSSFDESRFELSDLCPGPPSATYQTDSVSRAGNLPLHILISECNQSSHSVPKTMLATGQV